MPCLAPVQNTNIDKSKVRQPPSRLHPSHSKPIRAVVCEFRHRHASLLDSIFVAACPISVFVSISNHFRQPLIFHSYLYDALSLSDLSYRTAPPSLSSERQPPLPLSIDLSHSSTTNTDMWPFALRQNCPSGTAYHVCQNGFKGCCSVDPCNPGDTCPDVSDDSSSPSSALTSAPTDSSPNSSTSTTPDINTPNTPLQTATRATSIVTVTGPLPTTSQQPAPSPTTIFVSAINSPFTSASSSKSSSAGLSAIASPTASSTNPACPTANNTVAENEGTSNHARYKILCGMDSSADSSDAVSVVSGGFSGCFAACDNDSSCAGFSFVGSDNGTCHLKSQIGDYVSKPDDNLVLCVKTRKDASETGGGKHTSTGTIVGAVVGSVVGALLLLLIAAFFARRRMRKSNEMKRATLKNKPWGKLRGGSDNESMFEPENMFAPYGGNNACFLASRGMLTSSAGYVRDKEQLPNGDVVEDMVAQFKASPQCSELDSQEKQVPCSMAQRRNPQPPHSTSQAMVAPAHGNTFEMEDTSPKNNTPEMGSSPAMGRQFAASGNTLVPEGSVGDRGRLRQHVMSWNTFDPRNSGSQPSIMSSGLSPRFISPDTSPDLPSGTWAGQNGAGAISAQNGV